MTRCAGPSYSSVLQQPITFLNPKPLTPNLRRHPLAVKTKERRGRREGLWARRRRSSPFLCRNRSGSLSSTYFPSIRILFSLFMVVPPCVLQLRGSQRVTVTLAARKMVGNRCWDHRRCLCCSQGQTLGETCPCCRTCFPSSFRDF